MLWHAGMYGAAPGAHSPVYYPGSVRIPNGEYPPPSLRILNGADYPSVSMRVPPGEDLPGVHAATPGRIEAGHPVRPPSASWRDNDGLSAALHRNRDSELADIFAAPSESHILPCCPETHHCDTKFVQHYICCTDVVKATRHDLPCMSMLASSCARLKRR